MKASVTTQTPQEVVASMREESDRSVMILQGSIIEEMLEKKLRVTFAANGLNKAEVDRLFGFGGIIGTFSSKIVIAHASGFIDRNTRKSLDTIREIRNVAAHAKVPLSFETKEVSRAFANLFEDSKRTQIEGWKGERIRPFYMLYTMLVGADLMGKSNFSIDTIFDVVSRAPETLGT